MSCVLVEGLADLDRFWICDICRVTNQGPHVVSALTVTRVARRWIGRLVVFGFCGVVLACGENAPETALAAAEQAAANAVSDTTALDNAAERFSDFLERYPQHESAPRAMRMLAIITQQQGNLPKAIEHYERLLSTYASSQYAADAQFMIGFISEEYFQDYDRARVSYQMVIDNYPDSDLATSAQRLLPHVGKAPEEWVKFQGENIAR